MPIGEPVFYPASPIEIRDGTAARLTADATAIGLKNVFKSRTIPTKDDQIPFAAVWHAGERTEPNGDANVGSPSFIHTLTLVIDVVAKAGNETALDTSIVNLVETIRATLLTDPTWVNLFEGIERCDTRYSYPKETNDFLVEAMIEIEVTFRSEWPPYLPNMLKTVTVTPTPPGALNGFTTQFDNLDQ